MIVLTRQSLTPTSSDPSSAAPLRLAPREVYLLFLVSFSLSPCNSFLPLTQIDRLLLLTTSRCGQVGSASECSWLSSVWNRFEVGKTG